VTAEPKEKKRRSLVLIIAGGLVLLCIACGIFGVIAGSTPEAKATSTARAIARATEAAKPTATPGPTNTSLPTRTPLPTSTPPLPAPTSTPLPATPTCIPLAYEKFYADYQNKTELQQEQYKSDVVGTRVHWSAKVEDVSEEGRIHLQGVENYYYIWVYLDGVPIDQASGLNKGQPIEFEATVRETGTGLLGVGFAVYLDNPVIISVE